MSIAHLEMHRLMRAMPGFEAEKLFEYMAIRLVWRGALRLPLYNIFTKHVHGWAGRDNGYIFW